MTAKLFFQQLGDASELSGSTPVLSGGDPINLLDGLTSTYWKPDTIGTTPARADFDAGGLFVADYVAIDVHNLHELGTMDAKLWASTDAAFTTPVFLATLSNQAGAMIAEFTNTTSYRYYRLEVRDIVSPVFPVAPIIGVLYVGAALELPEGIKPSYTPPKFGAVSEVTNNKSGSGEFIGRSKKRKHYEFVIKNDNIAVAWMRSNWNDLYDYIESNPFFYLWNDLYSNDGVYAWTVGKIAKPKYQDQSYMMFNFKCEGYAG